MNCPHTGEVCFYRTHFAKIGGMATLERALGSEPEHSEMLSRISENFSKAVDATAETPCDERFCSVLSRAVAMSLVSSSVNENRLIAQSQTADKGAL